MTVHPICLGLYYRLLPITINKPESPYVCLKFIIEIPITMRFPIRRVFVLLNKFMYKVAELKLDTFQSMGSDCLKCAFCYTVHFI